MSAGALRGVLGVALALVLALAPATSAAPSGSAIDGRGDPVTRGLATARGPVTGCPRTRAIGAIRAGMTGLGWTTVRGDRPVPFRVRVLGTLRDGIAPGRDLVVIKVSDLPGRRVVRVGGGIWSGMSGSPVYIRGALAGAISYSLADGPSPIGGMTPARYMERLVAVPAPRAVDALPVPGATAAGARDRIRVGVTGPLAATIAAHSGRPTRGTPRLERIGIPVAVSGAVGASRSFVARELRRNLGGVRMVSTGATSATAGTRLATAPRAGQNLASVIAQGDVTVAAVGTVTALCRGRVIGFGHPMTGEGQVAFGAARARTLTIVAGADPYKLANIGRTFGLLDVDRLTGIRALSGARPRALPVTARVRSRTTGRVRTGRTSVTMPGWMTSVAADHLLYDIQAVDERYGPGTARLRWTIRGVRLDTDTTWTLERGDTVTDTADVAYASALRLYTQLDTLVNDPTAEVRIRSVSIDATVSRGAIVDRIRRVEVSRNGGPWSRGGSIAVTGGDELRVRVSLRSRTGRTYGRVVAMTVPAGATGTGLLHVLGGATAPTDGCDPVDRGCPTSFGRLLDALRAAPRGDDLVVTLDLRDGAGESLRVTTTTRLAHVADGERRVRVTAD